MPKPASEQDIGVSGATGAVGDPGPIGEPGATGAAPGATGPVGHQDPTGEPTATPSMTVEQLTEIVGRMGASMERLTEMAAQQAERPDNSRAAQQARRAEIEQIAEAQGVDVKTAMFFYDLLESNKRETQATVGMEKQIGQYAKLAKTGVTQDEIELELQNALVTPDVWAQYDAAGQKMTLEQAELLVLGRKVKGGEYVRKTAPSPTALPPAQTPGPGQAQVAVPNTGDAYVPDNDPDFERYVAQQAKMMRGDVAKATDYVRNYFKKTRGGQA